MPVKKLKKNKTKKQPSEARLKTVKIKPHHARPYRKRHYGLLYLSILVLVLIGVISWQYRSLAHQQQRSARNFVSELFSNGNANQKSHISSSYGFSFSYDPEQMYASGVDSATGNLYLGKELQTVRPYNVLRVSPLWVVNKNQQSSVNFQYYADQQAAGVSLSELEKKLVVTPSTTASNPLSQTSTEEVTLDGVQFIKTSWTRPLKTKLSSAFSLSFVTYVGVVNSKPLVIRADSGLSGQPPSWSDSIIASIKFGKQSLAYLPVLAAKPTNVEASLSILDRLTMTGLARAAVTPVTASEKVSALYSPAVVKIYNVYCMDILFDGQPYLTNACEGSTGSGFFISSDGYIGTNGHVATANPKDIVITDALNNLVTKGDEKFFDLIAARANITDGDVAGAKTQADIISRAVDLMYSRIPDSAFTMTNSVNNLLVTLGQKEPNVDELISLTNNRKSYTQQDSIKHAELIGADYRANDGITSFKSSDVAIIKIKGFSFPVVKTGSISSVVQGGGLNILGFPANASDNGVVDSTASKVTLTTGKVSAVKNAQGSTKKLIETDTTIGHGNSGGPVLDDSGNVIGIATYTADGSGQGNGVFNYVRDVQDLLDLASKKSISLNKTSVSQIAWEKAVNLFYTGHYSKSLKHFADAKRLYPQNSRVDEFVGSANTHIKNGEDIKDFPIVLVAGGAVAALVIAGAAIVSIKRHKHTHEVYKSQVATGAMQPLPLNGSAQQVAYNPYQIPTARNIFQQPAPPLASTPFLQPGSPTWGNTMHKKQTQAQPVKPHHPKRPTQ